MSASLVTPTPPLGAGPPRRPGRKRSRAVDDAILNAALEVLRMEGYARMTMAAVIERAAVSSATLYRRWPSKKDLVVAALESLTPTPAEVDTGSFAGDLDAFLHDVARSLSARLEHVPASLTLELRRYPDLSDALREKFLAPRLVELGEILARARGRGEVRSAPPAKVALSLAVGPIYHRALVLDEPLSPAFLRRAVRSALSGLGGDVGPTG